jgi:hypothetical protein
MRLLQQQKYKQINRNSSVIFFKMTHPHCANNYIHIQHNFTIYDSILNIHATDNTVGMCHLNITAASQVRIHRLKNLQKYYKVVYNSILNMYVV